MPKQCLRCERTTDHGIKFSWTKDGKRRECCDQCFDDAKRTNRSTICGPTPLESYFEGSMVVHKLPPGEAIGSHFTEWVPLRTGWDTKPKI